ncbi:MAG: alpha/beta fold hydrolase [Terriglobales bacterium]
MSRSFSNANLPHWETSKIGNPRPFTDAAPVISEHTVTIDGYRMRYLRSGQGPALMLIHGLLGYSFSWRFNIPVLAQCATVYAPDLIGVGFSDRPAQCDRSLRATADRVLRFMDFAGIDAADVVGTSHGGGVAMLMAAAQSGRVRRLVLVAPVNPWSKQGRLRARLLGTSLGAGMFRLASPSLRLANQIGLRRLYGDPRRIPPGTVEGYDAAIRIPGTLDHLLGIMKCWRQDMKEIERALPAIAHIPTLLMWGSKDGAVLPASAAKLQRHFQNARLVIFEGAGHLPYEEVPEEFNRALLQFLLEKK